MELERAAADEEQQIDLFSEEQFDIFRHVLSVFFMLCSGRELDKKTDNTDTKYKTTGGRQMSWVQRLDMRNPAAVKGEQSLPMCTSKSQ